MKEAFMILGLGDIQAPQATLNEIFAYIEEADKPCVIAIDEFQQIGEYAEKMWKPCFAQRFSFVIVPSLSLLAAI